MKAICKVCICVGVLALAGPAAAAPTVFDFTDQGFTGGQGLEGSVFGLATVTSELGGLFYQSTHNGLAGDVGASADVYFSFSAPVCNVGLTAGDNGGDYDRFALDLYEFGTDNFLGRLETAMFNGPSGPLYATLNSSASDPSAKS